MKYIFALLSLLVLANAVKKDDQGLTKREILNKQLDYYNFLMHRHRIEREKARILNSQKEAEITKKPIEKVISAANNDIPVEKVEKKSENILLLMPENIYKQLRSRLNPIREFQLNNLQELLKKEVNGSQKFVIFEIPTSQYKKNSKLFSKTSIKLEEKFLKTA